MSLAPSTPNCARHEWQPALGACSRCGDYVCVRCAADGSGAAPLVCIACKAHVPSTGELLPWDGDGMSLVALRDTSLTVFKRPRHVFTTMADGRLSPAMTFAACWMIAFHVVIALPTRMSAGQVFAGAIVAFLRATGTVVVVGTTHFLALRALRAHTSWKLSGRTVGYAMPWQFPSVVFAALNAPGASVHSVIVIYALALYAMGYGRAGLSKPAAAVAALLGVAPQLAFIVWTLMRAFA